MKGDDHPLALVTANNLARAVTDQGRLEEAEAIYRPLMASARRALPAEHLNRALFQGGFGNLLTKLGNY